MPLTVGPGGTNDLLEMNTTRNISGPVQEKSPPILCRLIFDVNIVSLQLQGDSAVIVMVTISSPKTGTDDTIGIISWGRHRTQGG